MTKMQIKALDAIRANGGSVVRFNFKWDDNVNIHMNVIRSLLNAGHLNRIALPPRGPNKIVPVKYTLVTETVRT